MKTFEKISNAAEALSFARVHPVWSSSFADDGNGFRAYGFAVAQMVCGDLLDER